MVRAAAAGVVDFRRADPRSHRWRAYRDLMLREVEDQAYLELSRRKHAQLCAAVARDRQSREGLEVLAERLRDLHQATVARLLPWLEVAAPEPEQAVEQYRKAFPNWNDPTAVERTVALLRSQRQASGKG